jgi:acetolactate synthase-1/2/3 large subunit
VCAGPNAVAADIAKAIRIARSGRPGPVHLSLPTDALENAAEASLPRPDDFAAEAQPLDARVAAAVMQRMAHAERPMILVGPACMTRPMRALAATLEASTGVPVIGMESPRGVADASLGAFADMLARADCVVLVGKRLDFTLKFGQAPAFPAQAEVHQIDAEPAEIERTRRALGDRLQITASADAGSALRGLAQAAQRPLAASSWLGEVREALAYRPSDWDSARSTTAGRLHPVQMLRPLQRVLDSHPDAVLVCDGGEIGQWAAACLNAPHRVINGVAGSIGSGLPYALAARCAAAADAPVLAIMGDGTVGFHIAEFDTALRYGLGFVCVVGNDARWNAEYQIQLRDYGRERSIGCELLPTRYDAVAQAFGAHGEHVTDAAALAPAVERALASGLPACLNVMIEGLPAPQIRR